MTLSKKQAERNWLASGTTDLQKSAKFSDSKNLCSKKQRISFVLQPEVAHSNLIGSAINTFPPFAANCQGGIEAVKNNPYSSRYFKTFRQRGLPVLEQIMLLSSSNTFVYTKLLTK